MNQANYQKPYIKRPQVPHHYTKIRSKPAPKTTSNYSPKRRYNSGRTRRKPTVVSKKQPDSILKSLSSVNLVSILNSFYTIRSTVKDLRVSFEKLDSAMDSAYQMFEIAQGVMRRQPSTNRRTPLRLLPPPPGRTSRPNRTSGDLDKRAKSDSGAEDNPLAGIFENVDIGQIMSLLQSPLVQGLLKQFAQGSSDAATSGKRRIKEG